MANDIKSRVYVSKKCALKYAQKTNGYVMKIQRPIVITHGKHKIMHEQTFYHVSYGNYLHSA